MGELEQLMAETRALLQETATAHGSAEAARLRDLAHRATALREEIEVVSLGLPEVTAAGHLTDALAAVQLSLRALQAGDEDRASDAWEQAGYFLSAAEQAGGDAI